MSNESASLCRYRPRRLAITGATGALGTRFLQRMLTNDSDLQVAALVRQASPSFRKRDFQELLAHHGSRVRLINGDIRSLRLSAGERRAIAQTDGGLWHFAANTNLRAGAGEFAEDIWRVNDVGTAALLDQLYSCDRPGPFFHLSTAYVCGAEVSVAFEDRKASGGAARNSYEDSKRSAEQRVRSALHAGLAGAIFRPSVIVGDESTGGACNVVDLFCNALLMTLATNAPPLVLRLPLDAEINVVHTDWVIDALLSLAGCSAARKTYHLTSRVPLRLTDLASAIAPIRPSPLFLLEPAADPNQLSAPSRALNRGVANVRSYLTEKVRFDRANFDADAPALRTATEFVAATVVEHRIASACGAGHKCIAQG